MTLRQLELFIALVRNPHLSKVAGECGLTQSAVSMAIKSLEDHLEKTLFDRIHKKLVLNENGRFFFRMIEPLVLGINESKALFKDQDLRGDLKVAASSSIANYILPQIMYQFKEQFSGVRIQKITGNTQEVIRLIENNEVDIGFVEGQFTGRSIQMEVFGADELYVVTGDPEMSRRVDYKMEDLLSKRWIFREDGSGTREVFLDHLGKYKNQLKAYIELGHAEAIKSVLHHTNALSCLSRVSVRKELAASQLFRVNIKDLRFTRYFYTIWHESKYFSSVLQEFVYFAKETYKTMVDSSGSTA